MYKTGNTLRTSAILKIDPSDPGQQLMKVGSVIQYSAYGRYQDVTITDLITVGDKPKYMLMKAAEDMEDDNTSN